MCDHHIGELTSRFWKWKNWNMTREMVHDVFHGKYWENSRLNLTSLTWPNFMLTNFGHIRCFFGWTGNYFLYPRKTILKQFEHRSPKYLRGIPQREQDWRSNRFDAQEPFLSLNRKSFHISWKNSLNQIDRRSARNLGGHTLATRLILKLKCQLPDDW